MRRRIFALALAGLLAAGFLALPGTARGAVTIESFTVTPSDWPGATPTSAPAGSHPDITVQMDFGGDLTDDVQFIRQHFPAGAIPNPEATPTNCSEVQLTSGTCPASSELGDVTITTVDELTGLLETDVPGKVYNIEVDPPYIGGLGFVVGGLLASPAPFTVRSGLRDLTATLPDTEPDLDNQPIQPTERDYGLTGVSHLDELPLVKVKRIRYTLQGTPPLGTEPYISTTTACLSGQARLEADSYDNPGFPNASAFTPVLDSTDCTSTQPPFDPGAGVQLETAMTDTPSGYDLGLTFPPSDNPAVRHQSHLRRAELRLPAGTALSAAAAQGLEGCADEQLGFGTQNPPACPAASDIGDVTVESINLDHVVEGDLYLGAPTPQDTFRLFIAFPITAGPAADDDLWVKLDGTTLPDPTTGQLTTVFDELPPLPFTEVTVSLRGGDRAPLVNPPTCGTHAIETRLTPWKSAPDFPPALDEDPQASFDTSFDGAGAACPSPRPFDPSGSVSTSPTQAGADSTLSTRLANPDRHQLLRTLRFSLPPGLVGRLTGMPLCSTGDAAAGSCGDDTRVGAVTATVGSGPSPISLPGSVYLAHPLQGGDPASLSIVVPAKAGPFEFGKVVTRARVILRQDAGLDVALADDLPTIIEGVPIRAREIAATVDRQGFTRNPTSCSLLSFDTLFTSTEGAQKPASSPYQATGCEALPYDPKLKLSFGARGQTKKDSRPPLEAVLTQREGEANTKKAVVTLPDLVEPNVPQLQRPGALCTDAQLAANSCPPLSRVGTATAATPLLPFTLSGPVFIVLPTGSPLPKLAVLLEGGGLRVQLNATNGFFGIRILNTFDNVPDVPVGRFQLNIDGGRDGILMARRDLCAERTPPTVDSTFTAHSGKSASLRPRLEIRGCAARAVPRVSISLRKVASGRPVMRLRVRRAPAGEGLTRLTLKLPRSLRGVPGKARKGVAPRASRKLSRRSFRVTRRALTIKRLPRRGARSITVTLRRGALKPSRSLQRSVRAGRRPRVRFTIRVTDVKRQRFVLRRNLRPAS
jgi:hypothetical protein